MPKAVVPAASTTGRNLGTAETTTASKSLRPLDFSKMI